VSIEGEEECAVQRIMTAIMLRNKYLFVPKRECKRRKLQNYTIGVRIFSYTFYSLSGV
jgi:hypothetical protein